MTLPGLYIIEGGGGGKSMGSEMGQEKESGKDIKNELRKIKILAVPNYKT